MSRANIRVVLLESHTRLTQHWYQRKKLVLLLSALRHYADDLRGAGYVVDHREVNGFADGLREHLAQTGSTRLVVMASAEYAQWQLQQSLVDALALPVEILPNTQFLVGSFDPIPNPTPGKRYVMENFYRAMRREFGVLLDSRGEPEGGRWNFDAENRKPLPKQLDPPAPPIFAPDAATQAVMAKVDALPDMIGSTADFAYAVTHAQAAHALDQFITERLPLFGDYEDAMRADNATLYHSILSPYLNIGLLEPLQLIRAAEAAYRAGHAPLNAVEGFVRQIIGWREFMYWQYWRLMPDLLRANAWQATQPLPEFFWDGQTDMRCMQHVITRAIDTGYSHHIERLMIVSNFCTLAGITPGEVNNWFLACYIDAYDWVMPPNVIGMGLNADGGIIGTKPYIASAAYINRMSDYCGGCRFNHKQRSGADACPFNVLYWNFLLTHETQLRANPRFGPAVLGLRRIESDERAAIRADAARLLEEYRARR